MGLLLQDMDSMVKTAMAIKMETDDALNIQDAGVVKDKRGGRVNLLLLSRERSRGLIFRKGFRDRAMAIKAMARAGFQARQGRGHVSIAISLGT